MHRVPSLLLKPALHVIRDFAGAAENERGIFFLNLAQLSVLASASSSSILYSATPIQFPGLEERCKEGERQDCLLLMLMPMHDFGGDIDFTPGRLGGGTRDASLHAIFEQWRSVQRREHIWRQ
jgi:hypothetical protein